MLNTRGDAQFDSLACPLRLKAASPLIISSQKCTVGCLWYMVCNYIAMETVTPNMGRPLFHLTHCCFLRKKRKKMGPWQVCVGSVNDNLTPGKWWAVGVLAGVSQAASHEMHRSSRNRVALWRKEPSFQIWSAVRKNGDQPLKIKLAPLVWDLKGAARRIQEYSHTGNIIYATVSMLVCNVKTLM